MAGQKIFELIDVSKSIKLKQTRKEIIKHLNLKVREDEFICVMGPTGCGKSTLIRMMCGVDSFNEGIMMFEGTEVKSGMIKKMLKQIGVAFQSDNLFEWKTVEKNITYPIAVHGLKKEISVEDRAKELLELTGLKNYKNCFPRELSGGMRQRCAFGRALAHNPKILLLDQPFGALDAITRKILGVELLKLWKKENKTVVMVTNSVSEALMLAQKIVILSEGPACVAEIVKNPLTYEERLSNDLMENPTYLELEEQLTKLIHQSNA